MEFKTVRQELDAFYKIASKNFKRANISNTAIVIAYYTLVAIFPMSFLSEIFCHYCISKLVRSCLI